ncbi:MAG: hypothetical protein U0791_18445 [Gemmataceae bacterium]
MADKHALRATVADQPQSALPLAVDARELAVLLSASLRWVRTQDAAGKLPPPVRIAGRVLWVRAEIESWLSAGCPPRDEWTAMRAARK